MKWFVLIVCCVELALSLPQGYNYKEPGPAPGLIDAGLGGFKPILSGGQPCNHGPNAAALVQQQSVGRIINNQQGSRDVLISGGGGGGLDSQAVTVNSHIVVGDGGHSQIFREGQGYSEQSRPQPIPLPLPQGPALPAPGPAQSFVQTAQQAFGSQQNSYASSNSFNGGAIINGIGKVPPPPQALSGGYQYASGFGGSKYSGGAGLGGPIRGPSFLGAPVNPNFIGGGGPGPRPIGGGGGGGVKFGGGGFQGSGSKFNSFQSGGGFQSGGFSHGGSSQSIGINSLGQSSNFGGNAILNGALGNVIRETFANAPLDPTVEKHIYVHVPPEDLEEKEVRQQIRLPEIPAKKHYKIIFIKAPSQQTNYAQIAQSAGVSEEKTIVYVLVKKPEEPSIGEIQQIQQNIKPSKPEVYFIKYKTRKEEGPGFIGGAYNSNIEQSQQGDSLGGGQFAGSDIDSSGLSIGSGSGIDSVQTSGGSYVSSSSSSSSSGGSSYVSGGGVNIGETTGGAQHAVYGVPNIK